MKYLILYCPMPGCQLEMQPYVVMSLGFDTARDDDGFDPKKRPYYRYKCERHGVVEVHFCKVMEP